MSCLYSSQNKLVDLLQFSHKFDLKTNLPRLQLFYQRIFLILLNSGRLSGVTMITTRGYMYALACVASIATANGFTGNYD